MLEREIEVRGYTRELRRLQRMPLHDTAIASPMLTADSKIQPTNISEGL
jgi:hypothetical protein